MSIYFCHQVEAIGEERQSVHTKIRWHPQYTLLALASKNVVTGTDGRISVCHDEVKEFSYLFCNMKRLKCFYKFVCIYLLSLKSYSIDGLVLVTFLGCGADKYFK